MALTYTVNRTTQVGTLKRVSGTIQFDASYPTGGLAFAPASVGLYSLEDLDVRSGVTAAGTTAYVAAWDRSTTAPKVKTFTGGGAGVALPEVVNATNLSTVTATFDAWGR